MSEGEPKNEDLSERRESARYAFSMLTEALAEAEELGVVDLSRPSYRPWAPELHEISQKETVEMAVEALKTNIKNLDPHQMEQAEEMIRRAKIYLAGS